MGKAAAARRLASAAAFGGGGLSLLGALSYGILRVEAKIARKAIGRIDARVPDSTGWYGRGRPGPAIKVALLGDSSAAGYGVERLVAGVADHPPGEHRLAAQHAVQPRAQHGQAPTSERGGGGQLPSRRGLPHGANLSSASKPDADPP